MSRPARGAAPPQVEREYAIACENLRKAREAGVPMLTGTDTGFAVTPYGEWHALELELFVRDLGFTPAEALRCATSVTARFMDHGSKIGVLETGRFADFIAVDGSPLENIAILQDKTRIRHVHIGGKRMQIPGTWLRSASGHRSQRCRTGPTSIRRNGCANCIRRGGNSRRRRNSTSALATHLGHRKR